MKKNVFFSVLATVIFASSFLLSCGSGGGGGGGGSSGGGNNNSQTSVSKSTVKITVPQSVTSDLVSSDITMENTQVFYYQVYFCEQGTDKVVRLGGAISGGTITFNDVPFGTYDFTLEIYLDENKYTLLYEYQKSGVAISQTQSTVTFPDRSLSDFSDWFLVYNENDLTSALSQIAGRDSITEEKKAKICLMADFSCTGYDALVSSVVDKIIIEPNGHLIDKTVEAPELPETSTPSDPAGTGDPSDPSDPTPSSGPEIPDGYTGICLTGSTDFNAMRTDVTLVNGTKYYFYADSTLTNDKLAEFQSKILMCSSIQTNYGNGRITFGASIVDLSEATGVTTLGSESFYNSLTSIILPPNIDSQISGQIFENTTSLTSISIADTNENFCTVDGVLYSKDKTKLYKYPAAKEGETYTLPSETTWLAYGAFEDNKYLEKIEGLEQITTINSYQAFAYCSKLTEVNLTNTALTYIPAYTFQYSTALKKVTLSSTLTSIGGNSFRSCNNLEELHLKRSTPPSLSVYNSTKEFYGCSKVKFYVPTGAKNTYQNSNFMSASYNAQPGADVIEE